VGVEICDFVETKITVIECGIGGFAALFLDGI
jgi:hypothetical protein